MTAGCNTGCNARATPGQRGCDTLPYTLGVCAPLGGERTSYLVPMPGFCARQGTGVVIFNFRAETGRASARRAGFLAAFHIGNQGSVQVGEHHAAAKPRASCQWRFGSVESDAVIVISGDFKNYITLCDAKHIGAPNKLYSIVHLDWDSFSVCHDREDNKCAKNRVFHGASFSSHSSKVVGSQSPRHFSLSGTRLA